MHIYTRGSGSNRIILGIHVDDQVIAGPNKQVITKFKQEMGQHFEMKDLGPLTHILGMEVKRDRRHRILTLSQGGYIKQILDRYGMTDFNPTKLPCC